MLQPVRVLAIAAICRSAAGLHIGRAPGLWTDRAQERGRMKGAGTDFQIERLDNDAAQISPVLLQGEDQALKCANVCSSLVSHVNHLNS